MSPYLRNLLEDAADDGGRPLPVDLAAVRTAGRRATWRQRAIVGGGAVGAAAVITTVALVLAPSGESPVGPSTDTTSSADKYAGDPGAAQLADVLAPLIELLEERGYETTIEYDGAIGGGSSGGKESRVDTIGLIVEKDGTTGSAVVAEFTDRAALALTGDGIRDPEPCAAIPVVRAETFVWDSCDSRIDGAGSNHWFATGGDDTGESLGVTLVRPDGTGLSVVVSTMPNDPERIDPPTPPLASVPVTHLELVEVVDLLEARTPLSPRMEPPTGLPTGGPPDVNPCAESVPAADECAPMDGGMINIEPLVESLDQAGLELVMLSESGGEGVDRSSSSTVLQLVLSDGAGRAGSAAVGVYSDLAAAARIADGGQATGAGAPWCAVAPVERSEYAWYFSGDPPAFCTGLESSGTDESRILLHDEEDADAVAATMVRADGSVVSVSVSQAPSGPDFADASPLAEIPLDSATLLNLLAQLDAANPAS